MTERQLIHGFVLNGILMRGLLWDRTEDVLVANGLTWENAGQHPELCGREVALIVECRKLLKAAEQFKPTAEELKQWEHEAHEKVWGKLQI